jgi:hypothetical protein
MAKKDTAAAAVANDSKAEEKKNLSVDEKKRLFDAYEKFDAQVVALDKQKEALLAQRSEAVKAIHDSLGKGPFSWKGNVLTIVARKDNFFFRGKGDNEVEKIG